MKKEKKNVTLNGNLLRPLIVGQSALVNTGGQIYHTTRVVAIHKYTEEIICFETLNTNYHLSMHPFPLTAIRPLPVSLAACA